MNTCKKCYGKLEPGEGVHYYNVRYHRACLIERLSKEMSNEERVPNPCKDIEISATVDHQTRENKNQRAQDTEWETTSDCAFDGKGDVSRISHGKMRETLGLIEITSIDKITIVAGETVYYYELVEKL